LEVSQESETPAAETSDSQKLVVGVCFQPVGKIYHFDATHEPDLREGDFVVVTTSRGQQLGQVAIVGPPSNREIKGSLKPVDRRATGRDLAIRKHWENKELEALITARELNAESGLAIKLVKAEYSFDGKRLTLLYSAEEHKETKALRQRLSRAFRTRVELRQIGPRDVAKIVGGYGACGGPRCCSTFLSGFSPISIRMAKAQGISLNPTEITGMCGRLRCCLLYEYEQYVEARKRLPKQGKQVGTPYGPGKVVSLSFLEETALVDLGARRVKVHREEIMPLEEWRALQEKAAQPCDHSEPCTCGRKDDTTAAEPPEPAEPSPPPSQRRESKSQRQAPRRSSKKGEAKGRPQKPPEPSATDQDRKGKGKSSRRRRRRRRR
jgi:cell fate regulator YaaT (PSP1 superfamily)